jgi:hypothetical protein
MVAALSSSVTSASVAVLGAAAVVTTYVADKYDGLTLFYVLMAAAAGALVRSLLVGGTGVFEIAQTGFEGDWRIKTRKRRFNSQVAWMMSGIVLLLAGAFVGLSAKRHDTSLDAALGNIANGIRAEAREVRALTRQQARLTAVDRRLARDLRLLARRTRDGRD